MSKDGCGETEECPAEGYWMVRSLELMSCEERLREMGTFILARRRFRCCLTSAHKYVKGRAKLFSIVIELNSEYLSARCYSCTFLLSCLLDRPWVYVIALSLALPPHQALELVLHITWLGAVHGHCSGPVGLCQGYV